MLGPETLTRMLERVALEVVAAVGAGVELVGEPPSLQELRIENVARTTRVAFFIFTLLKGELCEQRTIGRSARSDPKIGVNLDCS